MPIKPKQRANKKVSAAPQRIPEVLDVRGAAALLTVSTDTVYDLFSTGQLPGRKVGRKWITTKAAVLRWIESSSADDSLARAIERGDREAITEALNSGKARIQSKV